MAARQEKQDAAVAAAYGWAADPAEEENLEGLLALNVAAATEDQATVRGELATEGK